MPVGRGAGARGIGKMGPRSTRLSPPAGPEAVFSLLPLACGSVRRRPRSARGLVAPDTERSPEAGRVSRAVLRCPRSIEIAVDNICNRTAGREADQRLISVGMRCRSESEKNINQDRALVTPRVERAKARRAKGWQPAWRNVESLRSKAVRPCRVV
jgi:hypothetical protein